MEGLQGAYEVFLFTALWVTLQNLWPFIWDKRWQPGNLKRRVGPREQLHQVHLCDIADYPYDKASGGKKNITMKLQHQKINVGLSVQWTGG